jgi:hypothetical protein
MTPQYSQDVQHRILREPSSVLELIVQLEIDRASVRGDETVTSDHEVCREWPGHPRQCVESAKPLSMVARGPQVGLTKVGTKSCSSQIAFSFNAAWSYLSPHRTHYRTCPTLTPASSMTSRLTASSIDSTNQAVRQLGGSRNATPLLRLTSWLDEPGQTRVLRYRNRRNTLISSNTFFAHLVIQIVLTMPFGHAFCRMKANNKIVISHIRTSRY